MNIVRIYTIERIDRRIWFAIAISLLLFSFASADDVISFEPFGHVHVYLPAAQPTSDVVILVSGDGGWVRGVVAMAHVLSQQDNAFVIGIDINAYLEALKRNMATCSYPAGDFENLSRTIQERYGFKDYLRPLLIGYSSGATLVYAALVQAPPDTFPGAMSFGFCSDLPLNRPLCEGNGLHWTNLPRGNGVDFLPAKTLQNPWIAFQGEVDQVCNEGATENFVKEVPLGELVLLPRVGHGFRSLKNWFPQFNEKWKTLSRITALSSVSGSS